MAGLALLTSLALLTACGAAGGGAASPGAEPSAGSGTGTGSPAGSAVVPRPAHIVVVVLENHSFSQIIGSAAAPFLNELARTGALFTASTAVTHPSEPNYLALFSGSTHGVTGDPCPLTFTAPNLGTQLLDAGRGFTAYSEGLPGTGSSRCYAGWYARKHAPWTNFTNLSRYVSRPFSGYPEGDYQALPDVSFVIPDLCHDMHDCPVAVGDAWLREHLGGYARWAMTHRSLLIVTFDEDDDSASNRIATIFAGQDVRPGRYPAPITHYSVLATIEAAFGLPGIGQAAATAPITAIWRR